MAKSCFAHVCHAQNLCSFVHTLKVDNFLLLLIQCLRIIYMIPFGRSLVQFMALRLGNYETP